MPEAKKRRVTRKTEPRPSGTAMDAVAPVQVQPPDSDVLGNLAMLHRSRLAFVSAKVKIELQIKALQRAAHAKAGCEKKLHATCPGVYSVITPEVEVLREVALKPLEKEATSRLKVMLEWAKGLPSTMLAFADNIHGFGRPSLAQIIAESGALSQYDNPAKLWSRMGLGLAPDGNTRYLGRSPRRRALMAVIGSNFLRLGGPYREMYDTRKAYEQTKPACNKPLKNKQGKIIGYCKAPDADCCKAGHIHNRALRYVEKQLLKDLWRKWNEGAGREANLGLSPTHPLPSASQPYAESV